MKFTDRASVGSTKTTKEGYLVATARVARTGSQTYLARELGDIATTAGFKPNDHVRVYRHPDEVFHKDSLATITRVPTTVDHPVEDVNSVNWSKLSVGEIGDSYTTEPEWVVVNPMIKDAAAITAAQTTHKQISMGYSANIVKARDGIDADFEMTDIRYNHCALVPAARAGDMARIGDSWGATPLQDFQPGDMPKKTGGLMPELKTIVLGDKAVQVSDADVGAIEAYKTLMGQKLADAIAEKKKSDDEKDGEIGELKAKLKKAEDAAIIDVDALVAARTELVTQVHAVDSSIVTAGKTDAQLRTAAVVARFGDSIIEGATEAGIAGMFKAIVADAEKPKNPVVEVFKQGVKRVGDAAAQMNDAHAKSVSNLNAWRDQ